MTQSLTQYGDATLSLSLPPTRSQSQTPRRSGLQWTPPTTAAEGPEGSSAWRCVWFPPRLLVVVCELCVVAKRGSDGWVEVRSWEQVYWMTPPPPPPPPPHVADDEDVSNLRCPPGDDVIRLRNTPSRSPSWPVICREWPLGSSSLKTRSPPPGLLM